MKEIAEKRVEHFVETCRKKGIKATIQRREILRELSSTTEHPDAKTIYRRVRKRLPAISQDTVYRTLRGFEKNGDIVRVTTINERARYDANTDAHPHFICTHCGRIIDLHFCLPNQFATPKELKSIGRVERLQVAFRGQCVLCLGQQPG
ncbi:MAG: Fur family transcriptional regulator [Kiritimatiellia bacterium]